MVVGTVDYSEEELHEIMHQSINNNGVLQVGQEVIAAKLNFAVGANQDCVIGKVDEGDAYIGDLVIPPVGDGFKPIDPQSQDLFFQISSYNKGESCCAAHCASRGPEEQTIGGVPSQGDTDMVLTLVSKGGTSITFGVTAGSAGSPDGFLIRAAPLDGMDLWLRCEETFDIHLAPGQRALVTYGTHGCEMDCRQEYIIRARPVEPIEHWSNAIFVLDMPCNTGPRTR